MYKNSGQTFFAVLALLLIAFVMAGCPAKRSKDNASSKPNVPSPTPPAPGYNAAVTSPEFELSDVSGKPVIQITAQSGTGTAGGSLTTLGELIKGRATLYQKGEAVATLTADHMKADSKTRTLTATGNVLVRSRNNTDGIPKSVRADKMHWDYDKNRITGNGNVVMTNGTLLRIPGSSFSGDTAIQSLDIVGDGKTPVSGNF